MKKYLFALIGGLVLSIPWIILDFMGFVWALLAIPIAWGVEKGYRIGGGNNIKELTVIVAPFTLFIVISLSLYIMPFIYILINNGMLLTPMDIYALYEATNFEGVVQNLLISILFAAIGISGVTKNLKQSEMKPIENE